ncbi:MAG: 3-oxoacyl-[acyl-carrier-protein] reductase FabG [Verrucomicrobia subdivision 3 bacterium]|nr:3-oxoacyl-[acyl-carrier-protein] reductase FabG [Limisphaerales bacterium]MCS1417065.1 3-oxoacyl-[acyl-carrier-protein] reductase FabG [Limisphaerales bacterium]
MKLEGKVAIVTGSSRGVGKETASGIARGGSAVVVNYRQSAAEAATVVHEIEQLGARVLCVQADVSQEADCLRLVSETVAAFGGVDILVNNAATTNFLPFADLDKLTDDHWDRIFQTNVKGAFYCIRAAKPHLERSSEGGEIVNVSSVAGLIGNGSSMAYCASKAALISLTVSCARALAPNIRVNSVAPGFIADHWTQAGLGDSYEQAKQGHEQRAVLGKVCGPADVAAAILGLIQGTDLVTGQTIVCDGGMMIGPR